MPCVWHTSHVTRFACGSNVPLVPSNTPRTSLWQPQPGAKELCAPPRSFATELEWALSGVRAAFSLVRDKLLDTRFDEFAFTAGAEAAHGVVARGFAAGEASELRSVLAPSLLQRLEGTQKVRCGVVWSGRLGESVESSFVLILASHLLWCTATTEEECHRCDEMFKAAKDVKLGLNILLGFAS